MTDQAKPTAVWTEIPVTDLSAAIAFYEEVFGWSIKRDVMGDMEVGIFGSGEGVHGNLMVGTPAKQGTGPIIHLAVPGALDEAVARCKAAGGTILSPAIEIPPGRFHFAADPDGNGIGLFEPKAA